MHLSKPASTTRSRRKQSPDLPLNQSSRCHKKRLVKAVLQPSHMEGNEWIRMLDETRDAYAFESVLESHHEETLSCAGGISNCSVPLNQSNKRCATRQNYLIAPGDQIGRQRVEDWIDQQCISEPPPILQYQVNLVEALISNGILQEHDLRILSQTESESASSYQDDIEINSHEPIDAGLSIFGDHEEIDTEALRKESQPNIESEQRACRIMQKSLGFQAETLGKANWDQFVLWIEHGVYC